MKKTIAAIVLVALVLDASAQAQEAQPVEKTPNMNIGLGLGLDYGGIGGRFTVLTSQKFGLFAGLGYNFHGAGFNGGGIVRLAPDKRVCPTLHAMYGYNAVILIKGNGYSEDFKKTYYGPSVGFGLEFHSKYERANYFNLQLLVPIRSGEYHDDMDALKSSDNIEINEPWPVTISIGYHFGLW